MAKSTEVAPFEGKTTLAERQVQVGRGSENVLATDMAIPRLKLLQMISDEVQPGGPKQVEGAQAGMIMNSVSNELYSNLFLINLHFAKKIVVWKKRAIGGGMFGTFETEAEARLQMDEQGLREADHDISENPTHLVYMLDETGAPKGIALLDMPSTKIKVSKKWNALINEQEQAGNPRFGCVWQLGVASQQNNLGNFSNYTIKFITPATDAVFAKAEEGFNSFFGKVDKAA
jgi:hypothetical protein|tara:strand:+ start:795 stop:1487 length:693 start_codon:yes stop_codon:yes gene_type:complete